MSTRSFITTSLVVAAMACGDSTAVERNNSGTGTTTLNVVADIDADDVAGGFVTDFDVRLRDGAGNAVSGATVTVGNSQLGDINLLETDAGSGDYTATRNLFPNGDFTLNVTSGTDNVRDVVLGGPGVHEITEPLANSAVPADQPLVVKWTIPTTARSAEVETRDMNTVTLADTGAFSIPGIDNPVAANQRIRVFRFNEVNIAGGLLGSRMRVKIRQTVEPVIVQ